MRVHSFEIGLTPIIANQQYIVNGERFAGLNFRGFESDRESFSVNILHEL